MITIAKYINHSLADIVCGRLLEEGFHAHVADDLASFANEGGIIGSQGVRIQVPTNEAEDALLFLHELEEEEDGV